MNARCSPGQLAAPRTSIHPFIYRFERPPRAALGFYVGASWRNPPAPPAPHTQHPHNSPWALPRPLGPFPGRPQPRRAGPGGGAGSGPPEVRHGGALAAASARRSLAGPGREAAAPCPQGLRGRGLRGELCPALGLFIPKTGPWEQLFPLFVLFPPPPVPFPVTSWLLSCLGRNQLACTRIFCSPQVNKYQEWLCNWWTLIFAFLVCSLAPTLISLAVMSHRITTLTVAGYPCPVPLQPQKPFP